MSGANRNGAEHYLRFAAELSNNLSMVAVLLAEHPAAGDCLGCRVPSSSPPIPAPCGCRSVAVMALRIRAAREAVAADDALITDLGDGAPPPEADPLGVLLAAWRDEVDEVPPRPEDQSAVGPLANVHCEGSR